MSTQRGSPWKRWSRRGVNHANSGHGGTRLRCALTWLLAAFAIGPIIAYAQADEPARTVRVAGPLAAQEMLEALVAQLDDDNPGGATSQAVDLTFQHLENAAAAAGALLFGRADLTLTFGAISDRDLRQYRARWGELDVQEHIVGVRAVAIVVHPRNPVESLSMAQLQAIFSGRVAQWSIVGGGHGQVRRYGLPPTDPLTTLFHDKVLSTASGASGGRAGMIVRRRDSSEALTALQSDPNAIAYVDAVAAAALPGGGDAVRIVTIGEGDKAIAPNAQTLKDGSYVLSEPLVMYVSPHAPAAALRLVQHILTDEGDATFRRFGFMPALREVRADVMAAFEALYGEQIRRVQATAETADDIALAHQMVQSARTMPHDAALITAMCEAAYDLAAHAAAADGNAQRGRAYATAFEALGVLAERVPETRFDCALKHAALYQQAFEADQARQDGEHLVESLMRAADLGTEARQHAEALQAWRRAQTMAERIHSPRMTAIEQRLPAFAARVESFREAQALAATLRTNPQNAAGRHQMLILQLVELDDPTEAVRYLDAARDETIRTNVPLAGGPLDRLSADAALTLAEWYAGLMEQASVGGVERMAARARLYYLRFFELHEDREDTLAIRAAMGIRRVGGSVPAASEPPTRQARGGRNAPVIHTVLRSDEEMTDLKLAEFVAANPGLTRLTRREIDSLRHVTDLSALARLDRLTTLELQRVDKVTDITPLTQLPNLTSLTLRGLTVQDITPLSRLFRLTSLTLTNARQVTDLTPLSRLANLTSLNLTGCEAVTDLTPLQRLDRTLTTLNLTGCAGVENFEPLSDFRRLRTLDLRRSSATAGNIDQLQRQLIHTRVLGP